MRSGISGIRHCPIGAAIGQRRGGSVYYRASPRRRLGVPLFQSAITCLHGPHNAFLDHIWGQAVKSTLKGVAGVDTFAVYPSLAVLPVDIVAEKNLVKLLDIVVV